MTIMVTVGSTVVSFARNPESISIIQPGLRKKILTFQLPMRCHSKANGLRASSPERWSSANPLPTLCQSNVNIANLMPIQCQSCQPHMNPRPIWCQSKPYHLGINPMPIECQSDANISVSKDTFERLDWCDPSNWGRWKRWRRWRRRRRWNS